MPTHTRRGVLASVVALSSAAGCLSGHGSAGERDSSEYGVSADRVPVSELGGAGVLALSEAPESVRPALEAAVESRYETETVTDSLAATVADREYVVADRPFRLEATFPEYVLTLSPVKESVDPDRVVGHDEWAAEPPEVLGPLRRAFEEGSHRSVGRSDALAAFAANADYVTPDNAATDDSAVYAPSLSVDDPGPPYVLDAVAVDWDRPFDAAVYAFDDLPEAIREEVERAVAAAEQSGDRAAGTYTTDDQPAILGSEYYHGYVAYEGAVYTIGVSAP